MNLSSLSVRRGVTFGMLYLLVVGFGLYSLARLNLDLFPDISFPSVIVITNYTGASPEDIETLVTRPLEGGVASVKNVKRVLSESKNGVSLVTAEFEWGHDMELAETHVRRALDLVKGQLPEDAQEPIVFAFDPSLQPVVMMMISGPYPLDELRRIAEREIQPRLERLPGVASAEVAGGQEREIHVVLEPVKLEAFAIDVNAIIGAIYQENLQIPGGSVEQGSLDFTVHTLGKYQSVQEIGEILVGMKMLPGAPPEPVRLKEVARIEDTFIESQRILEVDGEPTVWVIMRKQSGSNTVRTCETILKAMPQILRDTGADITYRILWDQSDVVKLALGNLSQSALVGIVICFFVLLFFLLNIRSALIVSTAIPISVIATFAVMDQAHMTLNILSMAGLSLGIGMLVDNAIVVLENIFRLRQEGLNPWQAAIRGAGTVGLAVTASTLTTVAVFVPVLFVPGIAGVLFRDMAVTICFSLLVSLVVSLTFIPLAASRLLASERAARLLQRAQRRDLLKGFRQGYHRVLGWFLNRRWIVGVGLVGIIALTVVMGRAIPKEFISADDQSFVFLQVESAIGNNLQTAYLAVKEVEKQVLELVPPSERRLVALDVGVGKGFVSIFSKGVHAGTMRVMLVPVSQRKRSQQQIEDDLRQKLRVPGVKITIGPPFNPMGGEGDIEIQIRGHDLEASRRAGLELEETIGAMPEVSTVKFSLEDQKPEVRVRFDRSKLAELGVSSAAANTAISAAFMGRAASRYSEEGDEYDILVRLDKKYRLDVDQIRRLPIASRAGAVIPLMNIADVREALGPVNITRLNQERVTRLILSLKAEYTDEDGKPQRKDLARAIERVERVLKAYPWPKDFTWFIGGTAEDFQTSFKWLGLALMVAIFIVFMVMASQFESLRQPFIIMFTVPLAGIGVVIMFALTQTHLDVSALIGIIMLPGIVVNNGIVMVDAANQLRQQGLDRKAAIWQAATLRMRPVLMTALTTILAMVPLALGIGEGAADWIGMARAVIGGLATATVFTLVVVPVIYTLFSAKELTQRRYEESPSGE